jgi:hypothetical protein
MFRFIEFSANMPSGPSTADAPVAERDRQLTAIAGFAARHDTSRAHWHATVDSLVARGDRPVLWGAGSRGVQFLTYCDPDRRLAAVVDLNPNKWGRYLPVTAHRVESPAVLAELQPRTVVITNPAYSGEIAGHLTELGVTADILIA